MPLTTPQLVLLDRGQAQIVRYYLQGVQKALLLRDPQRGQVLTATEALSLKPLQKLIDRLQRLAVRDGAPRKPPGKGKGKPHRLNLPYDELTTVRLYYGAMLAYAACTPENHAHLATVLMRFHQPSLSLETYVRLPPPTGPGAQASML